MSGLRQYLDLCKEAYYNGFPIIADSQYDELEEMCEEELGVGSNAGNVKHWHQMYSLKKYYEGDTLPTDGVYLGTPKLDGAAVALRYYNGVLVSVVKRGNGIYGEDISHLFSVENCIRLGIPSKISIHSKLQVNGEVVAPKTIPNARNYAAGALGLNSRASFAEKDLTFFAYDAQPAPKDIFTYSGLLGNLDYLFDFKTVQDPDTKNYPQDGKVYRLENIQQYYDLGFTSKHPRGAFALKERTEGIKTTLLDVIWQTGKSGKVTPVAWLSPIVIDGAIVSKATLNNPGFIKALDLKIGDEVMVERAGGIIPRIIKKAY